MTAFSLKDPLKQSHYVPLIIYLIYVLDLIIRSTRKKYLLNRISDHYLIWQTACQKLCEIYELTNHLNCEI